ncbi:hypothetical protein GA0116948_105229 [Chitinophaga costaii]|uniref:Secreted protein n=1 Tax=Chitinophaga costaii TaxID=1335309 RepID=A0A1C4DEE0_9BACT|nr:hypothetical protein GA0116948_105229 [Chitinophaga costaii]
MLCILAASILLLSCINMNPLKSGMVAPLHLFPFEGGRGMTFAPITHISAATINKVHAVYTRRCIPRLRRLIILLVHSVANKRKKIHGEL